MINVIFCGYRTWAINVINGLKNNSKLNVISIIKSKEEYDSEIEQIGEDIDLIIFLGWSWIVPEEITNRYTCIGIHPSDLPYYRGGSPIQYQIINGIINTKLSLMTISEKLDGGDIWLKKDVDFAGDNIDQIFENIKISSINLLNSFFNSYPNIKQVKQDLKKGTYFKRRKPEESRIEIGDFKNKSLEKIYNKIRCLTDPYPNAFIEDSEGNKLFFTGIKKKKKNE